MTVCRGSKLVGRALGLGGLRLDRCHEASFSILGGVSLPTTTRTTIGGLIDEVHDALQPLVRRPRGDRSSTTLGRTESGRTQCSDVLAKEAGRVAVDPPRNQKTAATARALLSGFGAKRQNEWDSSTPMATASVRRPSEGNGALVPLATADNSILVQGTKDRRRRTRGTASDRPLLSPRSSSLLFN